eukprot:1364933-Pyramimonas_sp.AAC.1
MPLTHQHPFLCEEYPSSWIFQQQAITEEVDRGYMSALTSMTRDQWARVQRRCEGMHGAALSAVPGIFGERPESALAANSGTMIVGVLSVLLDIGSNINIIGLKTAQTCERVSRSDGHGVKILNLTKRLH